MNFLLFLLTWLCMAPQLWAMDAERLDVRILIDVSGSMKRTDPDNLRQPALRLLAELLPLGAKAGVWSFERDTVNLAPLQNVDAAWRQKASKSASQIHSRGLFTHIEGAIQTAAGDWHEPDPAHDRHLILLTDGMVDVSPQPADSQASRERILSRILPDLKKAQVRVHSVALSEESDRELLRQLSRETGGIFEAVDDPDRLQRIFLGLFEQASKADALPLKDNQFLVDKDIKEATVILFRSKDSAGVKLIDPQGQTFSLATKAANMRWFQDKGYELITIERPLPGSWQVEAETDPDNRVLVVTDLKMHLGDLPTQVLAQARLDLKAFFSDSNEPLNKVEFLRLVQVSGQMFEQNSLQPSANIALLPNVAAGGFGTELVLPRIEGDLELVVQGRSETFSRQQRQRMTLRQALKVSLDDTNPDAFIFKVQADADLTEPEFELSLKTQDGARSMPLEQVSDQEWTLSFSPLDFAGEAELQLVAKGQYLGQPMELRPEPLRLTGSKQSQVVEPPPPAPEPEPEPVAEPEPEPVAPAAEPEPQAEAPAPEAAPADEDDEQETPLGLGWMIFGAANVLGIILLGLTFWLWRKRRQDAVVDILAEDEETSTPALEQEAEATSESSQGQAKS
jgi:uncharacterized protein (TIGR03503 family)